ncbi:probably inactive leucine-rich repeat receptor-like protein kinase [Tanacetum coccineum]
MARAISAMVNISKNYVHDILTPYLHGTVSNLLQMLFGIIQVGNSCWELYCLEHGLKTIRPVKKQEAKMREMAESKDFVYLLDNCPHDWLFLQCAVVVYHGGAGTTAAGLKAACLTTVVPFFGQQFMLKPEVKVSATELAKAMANENGVKGAVDAFHKHFACRKAKPEPAELPRMPNHFSMRRSLGDLINKGDFQLPWIFRLKIAIGIAQGLPYLHKDYVPHLLHRDVKSRNVLLDNEFEPKLTDLALDTILGENAFRSSLDSKSRSSCYIAPELVTGRPTEPIDSSEDSLNIVKWIRRKVNISNGSVQVLDQTISSSCKQEALGMLEIALQCTSVVPEKRPSMWEVVAALQFLGSKTRVLENGVKINLMCERIQVSMRDI